MIRNYLKIAWRNLWRNKMYSFINIFGLALGLTICMLIMVLVLHERSFDRFHQNTERIYAMQSKAVMGADTFQMANFSYATAPIIEKSVNDIMASLRLLKQYTPVIIQNPAAENAKFSETKLLYADANFFDFFSFKLLSGNSKTVLNQPFSVVISKEMAHKYFGHQNPVGKTLRLRNDNVYLLKISGVMENSPSNTDLTADFIVSIQTLKSMPETADFFKSQVLQGGSFTTYFMLKKPENYRQVTRNIQTVAEKNSPGTKDKYKLTALRDMHMEMNYDDTTNLKYLKVFPLVAALVLLLALVNYMSLATARATLRAKEVGVRKVNGASRKTLIVQFYVESAIYTILSFLLAFILVSLLRPWFFNILQLNVDASFIYQKTVIGFMAALMATTVLLAGSYPAFVLSAYNPAATISGKPSSKSGGVWVRKSFTVLQFVISVVLIISGIIINKQLYFMRHTNTGVNRENVLTIPVQQTMGSHYQAFRKDITSLAGVKQVAAAHYAMYKGLDVFFTKGSVSLPILSVDEHFISTLSIQWKIPPVSTSEIIQPRNVVINEAAITKLNLQGNPIGQKIDFGNSVSVIAGVVKNFNFQSLSSKIDALAMFVAPDTTSKWGFGRGRNSGSYLFVKTNPKTNLPELLSKIKKTYNQYDQETAFEYQFMDDDFNKMFKAEDRLADIFGMFIGLTILIACMGLFGLAAFTAQQRFKEIGIRKILGASVTQITTMLSKDFLRLVVIALLIASPLAFFIMQKWLQDFAYHTHITWWIFAFAGSTAILVALFTISFQAVKAALANPVKSLKVE